MNGIPEFPDALCRDTPELFFPRDDGSTEGSRARATAAMELCSRCPELERCREYALQLMPAFGIFAGLTPGDRKKIKNGLEAG